jgi:glycine cleavage system H protein
MTVPIDQHYTDDHEWARPESDGLIAIGITDYAQDQLGEVVFIDLPEEGDDVNQGEAFGVVESTKSVSDLISPVTGQVVAVNRTLEDEPSIVNEDPYQDGWIVKVQAENNDELDGLMSAGEYEEFVASL